MSRPVFLVIGSAGLLGRHFMSALGDSATGLDLPEFDLLGGCEAVRSAVRSSGAGVVINCAAMTDVDGCEEHPAAAYALHRDAVGILASVSPLLVTFGTDHSFYGPGSAPRLEADPTAPANTYARSKLQGEALALGTGRSVVVRTSWLFAGDRGIVPYLAGDPSRTGPVRAVTDQKACVTYAPDLVDAVLSILRDGGMGLYHLVNPGEVSPFELAAELRSGSMEDPIPVRWEDLRLPARRPRYSALGTSRGYVLPSRQDALNRWRRNNG
ncbi:NAD(P)-dependent oxidoreductase [Candidatus Fermentibacteria bacterium]|nr:NAD(P)-dependent oxidoreductase [Candidatus Fermentibacteria bacterium]